MSRRSRARLSTWGLPSPVTRSYPGTDSSTAFPPRLTSRNPGRFAPAATRYSSGLTSPSGCPPCASRYWFISTVSAAQIGAACEVPPPTSPCWLKTILTPVNGSASAATSGLSRRWAASRCADTPFCQVGRTKRADTPPLLPWDNGESTQACSASHSPRASVDRVVPPTEIIAGSDATASSPISDGPGGGGHSSPHLHSRPPVSPLASKADVPWACAAARAEATGARSAAVIRASHPHPIDKLHTAPGN